MQIRFFFLPGKFHLLPTQLTTMIKLSTVGVSLALLHSLGLVVFEELPCGFFLKPGEFIMREDDDHLHEKCMQTA